jgi:hypothetical protein
LNILTLRPTIGWSVWFGSINGKGEFKRRLNDRAEVLDAAPQKYSAHRRVTERQFKTFVAA